MSNATAAGSLNNARTAFPGALKGIAAAQSIGRQLLVLRAGSPSAIDLAFTTLVEHRAGALLIGGDPFLVGRSQQLVAMATRHAVPAIYDFRESVLAGGLMSYGSICRTTIGSLGYMLAAS